MPIIYFEIMIVLNIEHENITFIPIKNNEYCIAGNFVVKYTTDQRNK